MRRSSQPVEILLGFGAGIITAFFLQLPLIWFLHLIHLTPEHAYSTASTLPLGVESIWSRVFWGGVFGLLLASFGTRYEFGLRYLAATSLFIVAVRTFAEWIVQPLFARAGSIGTIGSLLTSLFVNAVWAPAAGALVIGLSLIVGTWASKAPSDLMRHE